MKINLLIKELYETLEDVNDNELYQYLSDMFHDYEIEFTDENITKVYEGFYDKYGFYPDDLTNKEENYSKIINPIEPEI